MSERRTEAGKRLETRLAYDRDPASYLPGDFYPEDRAAIFAIEAEAQVEVLDLVLRGLRSEDDSAQLRAIIASVESMRALRDALSQHKEPNRE